MTMAMNPDRSSRNTVSPGANGAHPMRWWRSARTWRAILFGYVPFVVAAHLAWEIAQLPLYTIWTEGRAGEIAFAVVHCTGGDLLIAMSALCLALIITRSGDFVDWNSGAVAGLTVAVGLGYTVASERVDLALGHWTYAASMPIVPVLDVGVSPLAQWIVVPLGAFWFLSRSSPQIASKRTRKEPSMTSTREAEIVLATRTEAAAVRAFARLAGEVKSAQLVGQDDRRRARVSYPEETEPDVLAALARRGVASRVIVCGELRETAPLAGPTTE